MHYVSAEGLSKSYGIKPLFQGIGFHIEEGDKIALVARNGVGKSTLLKILAGQETPDEGKLWIHKEVKVVLFEQDPLFLEDDSVIDNIFQLDHPIAMAIRQYEAILDQHHLATLQKNEAALASLTDDIATAMAKMDELSAWDFEAKVRQILGKLNIHDLQQKMSSLSGGQRKRVALARTLIDIGFEHSRVLLIMDEPTNHLDVEMVEWLESFLNQQKLTLLLVTHDRYFLDAVTKEIWELDSQNLHIHHGDYAQFLMNKASRIEVEKAGIDKAKNLYRKELDWMRRQPKARTTKAKSRIDAFYDVENKAKQKVVDQQMELQVKMNRLGGKIAELKKLYKSFGDKKILSGFDYTFKKGERVGIIGKNGAGKSTFLQILQGLEPADSGKINIGDTIVFGNFSQSGLAFKEDMRVIEYVKSFAEHFPLADGSYLSAAQFLNLFLFPPEQQYTYLSKLSGGEKKRLQLLTVLYANPNFLILDEPTNDLDLQTLSVLENFLSDYPGCVLIVSHDRYFMDRLVDHLFVFEGDGVVRDFPGNYSQYRTWKEEQDLQQKTASAESTLAPTNHPVPQEAEKPTAASSKKRMSYKEKREFEQLETEIPVLEQEKKEINEKLASGLLGYEELQALSERIGRITQQLEEKELRWLELSEMMA